MGSDVAGICIFAKPPIPGRTKTRLAKSIGDEAAAKLAKAMLLDIVEQLDLCSNSQLYLFYPPDAAPEEYTGLVGSKSLIFHQQVGIDLGLRMHNAAEMILDEHQKCIIVGSDCVSVGTKEVLSVVNLLNHCDVVFQPADDGGYTLIGLATLAQQLFSGPDWGSSSVLADSLRIATESKLKIETIEKSFDVDQQEDLAKLEKFCKENVRTQCSKWLARHVS